MLKTVYDISREELHKRVVLYRAAMIALAALALLINALFVFLRTDQNHILMLILNIIIDIFAAFSVISFYDLVYSPCKIITKLILAEPEKNMIEIVSISTETTRHRGIDCFILKTQDKELLLPEICKCQLDIGKKITVYSVSGIITEVER